MTPAEHDTLIERHERLLLEANSREDRIIHCRAFLAAIERKEERTYEGRDDDVQGVAL